MSEREQRRILYTSVENTASNGELVANFVGNYPVTGYDFVIHLYKRICWQII